MGTFLLACIIGVVTLMIAGTVIGALLHAVIWLVAFPLRILFKVVPLFVLAIAGIGLAVALVAAVLSLLTPLLPVLLLGFFGWAIYRAGWKKPAPPPPPAFWS